MKHQQFCWTKILFLICRVQNFPSLFFVIWEILDDSDVQFFRSFLRNVFESNIDTAGLSLL